MKKFCLIFLLLFILPAVAADKVYKKVNPDGTVEYSDQPFEGSEEIPVQEAPSVKFKRAPDISYQSPNRRDRESGTDYKVTITSPPNNQTIRDNAGDVTLEGQVIPGLRGGHQLRWKLDDRVVEETGTRISLSNLDRGSHTARLEVVDQDGEVVAASDPVTFHLLRHSIVPPANPAPNFNPPKNPATPPSPSPSP